MAQGDADHTGQNNYFKYVAGLDPTNPASVFRLSIQEVDGQPGQKNLVFQPWASGRIYEPLFTTGPIGGTYAPLSGLGGPTTNGSQVTITDLNATQQLKFYRLQITLP